MNQNKSTYQRKVVLGGIGMQYKIKATNIYANISQAYRPILFSDLTPPSAVDIIDENLKDAKGYNAEIGYRGLLSDF
ncbi:MAG: TonB-dependent receptor [Saprospiraceae bacterium]|nr:TonB-dependent receptor [Saprospiraceae bacterium]